MSKYKVYVTAKNTDDRLKEYDLERFIVENKGENEIDVDINKKYQKILGFGGALTEASAYALAKLDKEDRKKVLESYYSDENGIGYNFARVHINSCDFALENYTYVEEGDETLDTFSL